MKIKDIPKGYFVFEGTPHLNLGVIEISNDSDEDWYEEVEAVDLSNFNVYLFDLDDEVEPCSLHTVTLLLSEDVEHND